MTGCVPIASKLPSIRIRKKLIQGVKKNNTHLKPPHMPSERAEALLLLFSEHPSHHPVQWMIDTHNFFNF
ncbi:hypothetical protein Tph_c25960 [Thermacetogenium phaeum DSM 12270]|uniref:Uncharacterized protein n=1 Tax=Thermacetogenium phaeum (strain ATCC BAA-254 / DSM 26808 / PB) TaxID=1089553 RepID=K4LLF7_THEPS|nr:hypothetical protein Tph_c25960 [Thermacetogenium phaeum DSM 12270]